jgi:sec-independent protein translocase protein TatA
MGAFSLSHWLIVFVVVLLVFGPKRLASVGKGLGAGIRNLKQGLAGKSEDADPSKAELAAPKK